MKTHIKATNFNITPMIEDWILEKIGTLNKFIQRLDEKGVVECWVEVGKTTKHHNKGYIFKAEVNMSLPGKLLRVDEIEDDLKKAIVKAKDEMQRQLKKYKGEMQAKQRRGARDAKDMQIDL
ncbi:MAG: ribosome-associated translation inhibitor RaiA [Patescibacteria group bacterium]|nr:ribosome-associated translation inhibitor RaiA [Patescibacteria group bacterium]